MTFLSPRRGRRPAFTLIELLVVVAIIAVLASLILPAVQRAREAGARAKCMNNLRNIALACLNFESSQKGLPRAGEHSVTGDFGSGVLLYKSQDLQSPFVLLLPYLEKEDLYAQYDIRFPYNMADAVAPVVAGAAQNKAVASTLIPVLFCPSNPLSDLRPAGKDSFGYAGTDYVTVPYVDGPPGGSSYAPAALTGAAYPLTNYNNYGASGTVAANKAVQLNHTLYGSIDALFGLAKIGDVRDGTAQSLMLYEDVGRNEFMNGGGAINDYYDPVTAGPRHHWRWADPDTTSGISQKVNNSSGGSMTTADPNLTAADKCFGKDWKSHDCGPNNEPFSFHGGGAHFAFVDGHIAYIRDSVSAAVLKSLATRSNGNLEGAALASWSE